jgi:hypothetical protein
VEASATRQAAFFKVFTTFQEQTHVFFVELRNIPKDIKITYGKIACDFKPYKKEKERVRLTVGGVTLDYSTADITIFKILINITLSKKDAAMMMMDIKNTIWALLCLGMNTCAYYYQDSRKKL